MQNGVYYKRKLFEQLKGLLNYNAEMHVTLPDYDKFADFVQNQLTDYINSEDLSNKSQEEIYKGAGQYLIESFKSPDFPVKEYDRTLELEKDSNGWKVTNLEEFNDSFDY